MQLLLISWFFIMNANFGYFISFRQMITLKIILVIIWQVLHDSQNMTEGNGHQIGILDNLLEYRQPQLHIHLKKKKY